MKKLILSLLLLPLFSISALAAVEPLTALTNDTFDNAVNNSPLAVVTFLSPSCGYSSEFKDILLDFSADNPTVDVFSVDSPNEPVLSNDFDVSVYPTTYVFRYGKRMFGFSGVASECFLVDKINSHK